MQSINMSLIRIRGNLGAADHTGSAVAEGVVHSFFLPYWQLLSYFPSLASALDHIVPLCKGLQLPNAATTWGCWTLPSIRWQVPVLTPWVVWVLVLTRRVFWWVLVLTQVRFNTSAEEAPRPPAFSSSHLWTHCDWGDLTSVDSCPMFAPIQKFISIPPFCCLCCLHLDTKSFFFFFLTSVSID